MWESPTFKTAACLILITATCIVFPRPRAYSAATWGAKDQTMKADGLVDAPDVLFRSHPTGRLIVGEAKSRHDKGSSRPYELYQSCSSCMFDRMFSTRL